jgi:hypothetical protein
MVSTITIEDIINGFEQKLIIPIRGEQTYATIHSIHKRFNTNATSVHSYQGGSNHGHLSAIISPTGYVTISPVPFIVPANSGRTAQIPANAPPEARVMEHNDIANAK